MTGRRTHRSSCHLSLLLALLLPTVAAPALNAATQDAGPREGPARTAEAWRHDLDHLLERLPLRHPNPFHTISEADFRAGVRALQGRVASLEEHERIVELTRLMARIGDGHTSFPILWTDSEELHRYPIELLPTAEGALVLSAAPEHARLVGADLLSIDGHGLDEVLEAVLPLDSRDHELAPKGSYRLMMVPEVLHAVGVAGSRDSATFELRVPSGAVRRVTLRAVAVPETPRGYDYPPAWSVLRAGDGVPAWYRSRDDAFWLDYRGDRRTLYVQYNDASVQENDTSESLVAFTDRLLRVVRDRPVERLVLDLRWNDGGAAWISRTLLHGLIAAERALGERRTGRRGEREPAGRLFVLIGQGTFSAGTLLAAEIEWHTNAVFIGQPTGGRPNAYGETGRFRLPETGYPVRTSIAYNQGTEARDRRPAIFPDVPVRYPAAELRAGSDPALAAVRSWSPDTLPDDRLLAAYRRAGVDAAFSELRTLDDAGLSIERAQRLLWRLASHLQEAERRAEALRVLDAAVERFPWTDWAFARRAQIHHARGEADRAVENACLAYERRYYRTDMLEILEAHDALDCAVRRERARRPT